MAGILAFQFYGLNVKQNDISEEQFFRKVLPSHDVEQVIIVNDKIAEVYIKPDSIKSKDIYKEYAAAGISTILEMHMSPDHLEEAKKANLNVVMTDHMASDSLGMNILMDMAESKGIEILDFSGYTRYSRLKNK